MDPLDQRLTHAGATWRQSQPEPPDLDRLVAGLDRPRSRAIAPRFALLLAAGLVLLGVMAVTPGVGGMFDRSVSGPPVTASSTPAPASPPRTAMPTSALSDAARATALLDTYEAALVAGRWESAFDLLAPTSPTHEAGLDAYAAERAPFFDSVAGRYTIGAPTQDVPDWTTYTPLIDGADVSRASLIEVDYPAMSGNNAGYEQFVVAPDASGTWMIWPVR